MVSHMKTTIDIADPLLRRAKRRAVERGVTLKVVVEEALRRALDESPASRQVDADTHVFTGEGLQPGLEWGDWDAVRGLIYDGRGG